MTTPATSATPPAPPRRRWTRRLGIGALLLLLLLAGGAGWLLGTLSGLRFALTRAQALSGGALSVQQVRGRLLGPLDLRGLRYDDGHGTTVSVATLHLDLNAWALLARRVHVRALDLAGVTVTLPKAAPDRSPGGPFSLQPPVTLVLDRARLRAVTISQAGQPLFVADRIELAGRWSARGLRLQQLAAQGPDGQLDLTGTLALGERIEGDGRARFAWKLGDTPVAGNLSMRSDGKLAHLQLQLTAPSAAHLQLDLRQDAELSWSARLDVPRFDPAPLLGDSALKTLAVAVQGHGDLRHGTLQGRLDLNDHPLLLQPLQWQLSENRHTLTLQQLALGSPQLKGRLTARGSVQLDARPLAAALEVRWDDLLLPAALAGQPLASHGELKLRGDPTRWHAEGALALGPPGKLAALSLDLDGTTQQITLHRLAWKQARGGLQASGTLTLQPALAWRIDARASGLDPGQLLAGWNGALDFDLTSDGARTAGGTEASVEIRTLGGTLRQRPVRAAGRLHLATSQVLDGQLTLASGNSRITLEGRPGASNDIDLGLAIASLGDWMPAASGRLDGHFRIRGRPPGLSVNGTLQGQALAWQQQRVAALKLVAGLPDLGHPAGKLELQASDARLGGLTFGQLHLLAEGSQADHRLSVEARGRQLSGQLSLHGAQRGSRWSGTLSTLNLDPQGLPRWHLQHAAQLGYDAGAMSLSELCLSAGEPLLCVDAKRDRAGNLDAGYRLHALPLALLLNAAGEAGLPVRADGNLDGSGRLHRSADGELSGNASLTSASGSVTYLDQPEHPLLGWQQLSAQAQLGPGRQQASVHASLNDGGRLDGQIGISGKQQALAGQLELHLGSLAPLELFSTELANVRGRLDGSFRLGGTLDRPAAAGQAVLDGFAAELPSAGLKLSQGRLLVNTRDAQRFDLDGSVRSGNGTLAIHGSAGLGADASTSLTLTGSGFTAIDLPAARVVVSPALTVKQDAHGIDIGGALTLDSAEVNLDKLPGAGAVRASPDVVVIDRPQPAQAGGRLPLSARIKVNLGNQTHVVGMGLDGQVSGALTVSEQPGRAALGQGQLAVSGTYKAYGQKLQIERGQLLFASTPLGNPGLNLRAVRRLSPNATIDDGQQVGLLISGTARRPILTVFSNPVMEQSDALSYLVTGKPLSQVKGGEANMVGAAAQALGSAAGNLLARSVGAKLGVDEIGVAGNDALGGNSAFTVGKYLSPRLYLSYGVGLFQPGQVITLRYRLSQRWNFEAQSATDYNRASLNYRIEK